jgi:hypothetical protein
MERKENEVMSENIKQAAIRMYESKLAGEVPRVVMWGCVIISIISIADIVL